MGITRQPDHWRPPHQWPGVWRGVARPDLTAADVIRELLKLAVLAAEEARAGLVRVG